MANTFWRFTKGIVLNGETADATDNIEGSIFVNSTATRIRSYINGSVRELTLNDAAQTLTNKTLTGNTVVSSVSGSGTFVFNTTGTITAPNATDTLVGKATTDTLTNKTLTGNTAVNLISGSGTMILNTTGTITLPNATDTLVGKATTDTLTNKTLTGNTAVNLISGSGTLVLNTTGTMTLPNATDTVVGKATTDTLTNKSISGSTNTLTNIPAATAITGQLPVANGGTALASGTSGGILGFTATGTIASSAALTASQLIIGGGPGATPTTLAAGSQFQVLVMGASNPGYGQVNLAQSAAVTGNLPIGNGGTGQSTKSAAFDALQPMTTAGDMIYGGTSGTGTRLAGGTANQVLKYVNGVPTWTTFSSGGINYISSNPDFEVNTTGWATYANAAGVTPVDGTGGSPSSTFTRSTSTPLRGTASGLWTKSANNRQGEGFSFDFTIDVADQGHAIGGSFDYMISSAEGTYADNDMAVYIYDVTNATLIRPNNYNILRVKAANPGTQYFSFVTASNSTSYRFIVHTASTSATAYTLEFDNFAVGPTVPVLTPGTTTPTVQKFTSSSGTYTTPANVKYIRVRLIGGGGGGGGSASSGGGTGGTGGNTTFGSSLLTGNGGVGGAWNGSGGAGGSASLGTGPVGTAYAGNTGYDGNQYFSSGTSNLLGGTFVYTPMGSLGSGGRGGHNNVTVNVIAGSSGGSGGYVDAIINAPLATYSYAVGAAGSAGSAGTSGVVGTVGGTGYIEVTEFYNDGVLAGANGGSSPSIQAFTTGTSQTYTTPAGVKYLKVRMVGGGAGGQGSGSGGGTGTSGGNSSFGTSLLTANGGVNGGSGGTGGSASITAPAIGTALSGGTGGIGATVNPASGNSTGGPGGVSFFGGNGFGTQGATGIAAAANTGSGGGGGGSSAVAATSTGGGAGGYVDAIITNPSATYTYSVGTGGAGGAAGTSGQIGGAGGAGYIVVEEYYQSAANIPATSIPGNYYASIYYPNSSSNYWSVTNTSFTTLSKTGTIPSPTTITTSNFGTISKATSDEAGINFVAPKTGTIKFSLTVSILPGQTAGSTQWGLKLKESTTSTDIAFASGSISTNNTVNGEWNVPLTGYFLATAGTTYNFILNAAINNSATFYVGAVSLSTTSSCLQFSMEYIS